jgi:hypothetical protein
MSSPAPSSSLRKLFTELEELFQTETETRVSSSVRAAERALAEHLNQAVRRIRQAAGFGEIAAVLCDASAPFCNGCAVFHVTEDRVAGERVRGADTAAAARFREMRWAAAEAAAFAGALESGEPVVTICSAAQVSPAMIELFGHTPDDKAHLFPLTVGRTTVGVLYAAGAVDSAALELLAQTAACMLEARQPPLRAAAPDLIGIAPASAGTASTDWDSLSPADRKLHLRAQRFARVQVAEMRLYRTDAVRSGRARGDLYSALQEAIDSGREAFRREFLPATPTMADYFHRELVHTLANDNPAWLGEKYPGPLV